jgi:putative copper export protein
VSEFATWLQSTEFSLAIQTNTWITPTLQSIHIVAIGAISASVLMIALRVLGAMRADEPFGEVWRRFAPWIWASLIVLAATGALLTVGEPVREVSATSFWLKMALIVVGVAGVLSFRAAAGGGTVPRRFAPRAQVIAVATLLVWTMVVFLGRAIAYDAEVWASGGTTTASAVEE